MNVLNIEHVNKIFGDKVIFDDVSYGIHEGDKIGIIGINGTGKTTLLKMIAGLEEPDQGQIVYPERHGLPICLKIRSFPGILQFCLCHRTDPAE